MECHKLHDMYCSFPLQEPDMPEVPTGQAAQPQAQDEFGLPAVPQRT